MGLVTRPGIEIAKVGEWSASTGPWNCTRAQLADAVRAQKSGKFRNPIIARGHTDPRFAGDRHINADGEPALGQIRNLRLADDGDSLIGDVLIPDWLDDELPAIYPSRSIEADLGVETADGDSFAMVMTGLSLLGVTKPAIQPLAELAAAEGDPMSYVAATSVAASMVDPGVPESVEAGAWDEALHPRGAGATGGQFVAKGSGYSSKDKGKDKSDQAQTVKDVQAELIRLGLLSKDSGKNGGMDGLFGPKTEAAVKKWQTMHGHLATGRVDKSLLATLQKAHKSETKPAPKKERAHKVKAAADELVAGVEGLRVREIRDDSAVFEDEEGRVWLSAWTEDGDEGVTLADLVPATVTYTPLASTVAAAAAHAMSRPLLIASARDWKSEQDHDFHGDITVDIAQLREALGLDDEADEAAALAKLAELKSKAEASETPPTNSGTTESSPAPTLLSDKSEIPANSPAGPDLDALVAEKVAAAVGPVLEANKSLVAEVGTLSGELAERKKSEAAATKERIIASALQQGKIAPAARETWSARYDKDADLTTEILASYSPGTAVPIQASGYAGGAETSQDDEILRSMGLDYLVGGAR